MPIIRSIVGEKCLRSLRRAFEFCRSRDADCAFILLVETFSLCGVVVFLTKRSSRPRPHRR